MRQFLYLIPLFIIPSLFAQNTKQQEVNKELKKIVSEANSLFHYRMMEWWASDLTEKNKELDKSVADYIIYHDAENLYFVLVDATYKQKLGTYYINTKNNETNIQFDSIQENLSKKESKLLRIKNKMEQNASKIANKKIVEREGYSVSTILIEQKRGYKLYLLANTSEAGIIPLGNDAVFHGNNRGRIKKWTWYHEGLLSMPVSKEGSKLATHKHKKGQVLISPTEIANFRLYGMLYNMQKMSILVEDKGMILEYDANDSLIHAYYPNK
ncbi:MAG TPA: hypothetical protein VKX30_01655 [Flavobacteriaceae bacterium]|nr:hypothetical protein [Flavobacteriaceae bacterium]